MIEAEKRIRATLGALDPAVLETARKELGSAFIDCTLHAQAALHVARYLRSCSPENIAALLAEIDRLTRERDAMAKQGETFRRLVDACKLLSSEAEEYEFDDGMGRGAMLDYWYEFDRKLDAALAQIEKERGNGARAERQSLIDSRLIEQTRAWIKWLNDPTRSFNSHTYEILAQVLGDLLAMIDAQIEQERSDG